MAKLEFKDLKFVEEKDKVKVFFLKNYFFWLDKEDLAKIGKFKVQEYSMIFDASEKSAHNKFNLLLQKGFDGLTNSLTGKKTVYIHKNSGIPLVGSNEFGIVDRGTSCIEVKPLTGCNLNCVFCSVNEGDNQKKFDFVVEKDYLVEEFENVAKIKKHPVEAHINTQGEPLLYARLAELVEGLSNVKNVNVVSIDTNATFLNKTLIDLLDKAGLTRLNISLNALDQKLCNELAGKPYNVNHILKMVDYCKKNTKIDVLLAPIIVPGLNESEIEPLIKLSLDKKLGFGDVKIGFQNFLNYKRGRNPVKQRSFEEFYDLLGKYEKTLGVKLKLTLDGDFGICKDVALEKPFKKGDVVSTVVISPARFANEWLAVAKDRVITVKILDAVVGKKIKVKLTRSKHNIFYGLLV